MSCLTPILLNDRFGNVVKVPCGHCLSCRKERSKAWGFRLMCECASWQSSVFLTLTYDEEGKTKLTTSRIENCVNRYFFH